ncbi:unnamed protein product [Dovyalis caffra]|uniref:Branched-chain-amino-acid aminotransferase n=1 Tax=Dovyalis caffra TaxID=77055 RepID=A0AAV1S7I0_9ROSI|nr:unnamed protein product [Dovyalis caffra]
MTWFASKSVQGLFEGTKTYRKEDGSLLLFRPEQNAIRMKVGAERMCMLSPSIEQFMDAVKQTAIANKRWVPPPGKGTLYIRPLLMGSGPILGLAPAPEYTFLTYASPVGNYFKDGFAPLNLLVEDEYPRSSCGGTGGVKTISNYAPVLKAMTKAKNRGFSDVLYLDSVNKKYIEEVSSCNIFIVTGNVISTPATNGTILPGVTRKSIIEIARDYGYKVEERCVPVDELINADEVFSTGTAVIVAPVGSITYQDKRIEFKIGYESLSWKLRSTLLGIQMGFDYWKKVVQICNFMKPLLAWNMVKDYSCYASQAASALQQVSKPSSYCEDKYAKVDWDNLGFGITPADYMYTMKCSEDGKFEQGQLAPYGYVELSPSAGGLYEGTKAYRTEGGRLLLFRLDQNAARMKMGADRLCMPCPSTYQFVDAVKQTALANKRWTPPPGKGTLYIRPLLMGSGPILGLAPAPEYTFLIYASPVGNYFKEGLKPLNLYVEDDFHRAARGGAGGVKSITNYAPVLKAMARAKSRGFSDVLYLDSVNKKYLEEVSSCNIFLVKGNIISTPATNGTILQGVTRGSIIEIARENGYQVEERAVPVDELMDADEVFCTGTAVGVAPVGAITHQNRRVEYKVKAESVSQELYSILEGIKTGVIEDKKGWILEL